jgi:hypothetical protein
LSAQDKERSFFENNFIFSAQKFVCLKKSSIFVLTRNQNTITITKITIMKASSFALKAAHKLMKESNFSISWSSALKSGWAQYQALMSKKAEIMTALKAGIFSFSFTKISTGEERFAIGTLNSNLFSYEPKGTGKSKASNPFLVKYWDLQANSFRSFNLLTFISALETIPMSSEDKVIVVDFAKLSIKQELVSC